MLFLVGSILFKHNIWGFLQLSHCAGIVALTVLALFAGNLTPLMLSVLATALLIAVAVCLSRCGPRPKEEGGS